jgi:hypothetical protein
VSGMPGFWPGIFVPVCREPVQAPANPSWLTRRSCRVSPLCNARVRPQEVGRVERAPMPGSRIKGSQPLAATAGRCVSLENGSLAGKGDTREGMGLDGRKKKSRRNPTLRRPEGNAWLTFDRPKASMRAGSLVQVALGPFGVHAGICRCPAHSHRIARFHGHPRC